MNKYNFGCCYGVITDNEDPDNLGRVKAAIEFLGESIETDWIPVLSPYASSECGAFFIPEVEDQVVVGFFGDNPDTAIVLGGFWSDEQKPPETEENSGSDLNKDGENNLRFIKSRSGHLIILDDKDGEEKIQLITSDGNTRYEFLAKDKVINIETDVDLKISAKGKLGIEADECEMKFDKGLKMEADGLVMESKTKDIEVKANQNLGLEGTTVKLN